MVRVEYPEPFEFDAGLSTCPECGRSWRVTPWDDCLLPACGCFGHDSSADNPNRTCEGCGIAHAMTCERMPGRERDEQRLRVDDDRG